MRIQDKAIYNELIAYEMPEVELPKRRNNQIEMIKDKLKKAGFDWYPKEPEKDRRKSGKTENIFYYKEGVDVVLCIINRSKLTNQYDPEHVDRNLYYNIIDKKTFDNFVKVRHAKFNISWNGKKSVEENANVLVYADYTDEEKERFKAEGKKNVRIFGSFSYFALKERDICNTERKSSKAIDHKTHNRLININKNQYLRECNQRENNQNKRSYELVKVNSDDLSFYIEKKKWMPAEIQRLLIDQYGLKVQGKKFISNRKYSSEKELYSDVADIDELVLGQFRYDPLVDFSETWYALVFEEMLKKISSEEREEYQRMYWIKKYQNAKTKDEIEEYGEILRRYMYEDYERVKR